MNTLITIIGKMTDAFVEFDQYLEMFGFDFEV